MHIYHSHVSRVSIPDTSLFEQILPAPDRDAYASTSVALIDGITGESLTRGQLRQYALTLGASLIDSRGPFRLKRDDAVLVVSPNSLSYPIVMAGAVAAGLVVSFANPTYTASELRHQLTDSEAKVIFVHPDALSTVIAACISHKWTQTDLQQKRIVVMHPSLSSPHQEGWINLSSIISEDRPALEQAEKFDGEAAVNSTVFLFYSSGTTGKPKGVQSTHKNIVSNMYQSSRNWNDILHGRDVMLAVIPWYHITGGAVTMFYPIHKGVPIVVLPRFEPTSFLSTIGTHKVTATVIAPPILLWIVKTPLLDSDKYDVRSLRTILSGSAPASTSLIEGARDRLKLKGAKVVIGQAYGLTETSPGTHVMPPGWADRKTGSVGRLMPNMEARLVDNDDQDVPVGSPGELWVRGPNVMKGYLKRPDATADTITPDKWLKTGDIATVDPDGFWRVVDRKKELIKYKGYQVPPAEMEALLMAHEGIADAGVIGVYSQSEQTELPRAYIVPRDPKLLSSGSGSERAIFVRQIDSWVRGQVVHYKNFRGGILLMDAIPRSAAGKILRKELRNLAGAEGAVASIVKAQL